MKSYLGAAAHPVPAALFVLPLLAFYELGVWKLAANGVQVRAGADEWYRAAFGPAAASLPWLPPTLVASALVLWALRRRADRPEELPGVLFGVLVESLILAVALWAAAKNLGPSLGRWNPAASVAFRAAPVEDFVLYVGAGVYEELLFRFALLLGATKLLRLGGVGKFPALLLAALLAACAFAAAHHLGPGAEPLHAGRFAFRAAAGLYFTALYLARGLGVAVGAHAGYDILVGVAVG